MFAESHFTDEETEVTLSTAPTVLSARKQPDQTTAETESPGTPQAIREKPLAITVLTSPGDPLSSRSDPFKKWHKGPSSNWSQGTLSKAAWQHILQGYSLLTVITNNQ